MPKLGVNIDHVATLRQARGGSLPDPIEAARICELTGADSIVCHLREDRRHINDKDVRLLRKSVKTRLNLEMSINKEIIKIATRIKPDEATLVPERRQELTTEGGLDVVRHFRSIKAARQQLSAAGIAVSLFIDPNKKQIKMSKESGVAMIELHTGKYADAKNKKAQLAELKKIKEMTQYAIECGLIVNAGHGLNYDNTLAVARIPGIEELNIGHSIIAHAVFHGLKNSVRRMRKLARGRQ